MKHGILLLFLFSFILNPLRVTAVDKSDGNGRFQIISVKMSGEPRDHVPDGEKIDVEDYEKIKNATESNVVLLIDTLTGITYILKIASEKHGIHRYFWEKISFGKEVDSKFEYIDK